MHSAGIDVVSNSEDEFTAGPVHHAVGKAHDGAAPPSVVRRGRSVDGREQDQQEFRRAWPRTGYVTRLELEKK